MRQHNKCRLYPYLKRILNKANKVKRYTYHSKYGPKEIIVCSRYEYLMLKLYNDVFGLNDAEYAELQRYNKIKRLYNCLNFKYYSYENNKSKRRNTRTIARYRRHI